MNAHSTGNRLSGPEHSLATRALPVDRTALLDWLDGREGTGGLVVYAVLHGLAERVRRGEFDLKADRA